MVDGHSAGAEVDGQPLDPDPLPLTFMGQIDTLDLLRFAEPPDADLK